MTKKKLHMQAIGTCKSLIVNRIITDEEIAHALGFSSNYYLLKRISANEFLFDICADIDGKGIYLLSGNAILGMREDYKVYHYEDGSKEVVKDVVYMYKMK